MSPSFYVFFTFNFPFLQSCCLQKMKWSCKVSSSLRKGFETGKKLMTRAWEEGKQSWACKMLKMGDSTTAVVSCCCCYCCVASVVSDSVRPQRRQPTRLPRPRDSPGRNTGVGCHFLLRCMKVKSESEVAQSCLTLHNPMDCSPPGSSVLSVKFSSPLNR